MAFVLDKALKSLASKDVWSVSLEQVWVDFVLADEVDDTAVEENDTGGGFLKPRRQNANSSATKRPPQPFLDSFPIILWIADTPHTSFDVEVSEENIDLTNINDKLKSYATTSETVDSRPSSQLSNGLSPDGNSAFSFETKSHEAFEEKPSLFSSYSNQRFAFKCDRFSFTH